MFRFRKNCYADVRIEKRFETRISIRDGNLEECRTPHSERAFLRLYDGKMWYYTSTSDAENVQNELDQLFCLL